MATDYSRPSTAGYSDALSESFLDIIPEFRRDLEAFAPDLVDKFDSIIRFKNDTIEEYGRRYNKVRAELARERTTALPYQVSATDATEVIPESEITSPTGTGSDQIPETSAVAPEENCRAGNIQQAVQSKHRVALTDSIKSSAAEGKAAGAVREAVRSKRRIPLTDSRKSSSAQVKSSTARTLLKPHTPSETMLTIKVQIRLLPVIPLLKGPNPVLKARLEARAIAHAALNFARDNNGSDALMGRCCFYIGRSYHDPERVTPSRDAIQWFQRATQATEAGYAEGQMAQECLNHYQSLSTNSRPSSSGSWLADRVNGVWNSILGRKSDDAPSIPSKPRPAPLRANALQRPRPQAGQRIPSFSTAETISPSSAGTDTRDHHGLKWSPNHLYGKGEILPQKRMELVESPEPIEEKPENEEEEEQHIPANVLGGLVEAGALSPAMRRSPIRPFANRRGHPRKQTPTTSITSDNPPARRLLYVTNPSTPSTELEFLSPHSQTAPKGDEDTTPSPSKKLSSYFPSAASRKHFRAQSAVTFASPPVQLAVPPSYSHSEPSGSPTSSRMPSRRGRNSLSLIIKATGFDGYRKRDEAAQMEEGNSPFHPREEEGGIV
ncbi:hypothetical protein Q7P37_002514 [Cladosporium fusiforme]